MKRRVDDIGFGGLKLVQDEDAFCYGTDAVLLANMACRELQITEDMRVCDLGTNTAVIPLIMSARCSAKEFVGVEVQEQAFELAQENLKLNSLMDRLKLVLANVKDIKGMKSQLLGAEGFDVVTTNPPYMESGRGLVSGNTAKAIARHELLAGLEEFLEAAPSCSVIVLPLLLPKKLDEIVIQNDEITPALVIIIFIISLVVSTLLSTITMKVILKRR